MGTRHSSFSRYVRFIEVPLAVILLGFFIFFGIQYLGLSTYNIHQGDAPLDIQAARGQTVDITIGWADSVNGDWASSGLTLRFDGQNTAIEIIPPQAKDWNDQITTISQFSYKGINIYATFSIANYAGPVTETLTGTIQGQITYPQHVGGEYFQDTTDDVSLPVRLHLIPSSEVLLKQVSPYLPAILLILLLGAGAFLRRRQVKIEVAPGATGCTRCQTETSMGRLYPFYFGAGVQQAYFCDRCISRGFAADKILVIMFGGFATLGVLIALGSSGLTDSKFFFLTLGILFVAIWYVFSLITLHRFRVLQKTSRSTKLSSAFFSPLLGRFSWGRATNTPQKTKGQWRKKRQWRAEGIAHHKAKRYTEALAAFDQAIALDPTNADLLNRRGLALYNMKRYAEALAAYDQASKLAPKKAVYHDNRGQALYNMKRYAEALDAYDQTLKLAFSKKAEYHDNRGNALYNLKRYEEAVAAYREASIRAFSRPRKAVYHNKRGQILYNLKRYKEAVAAFDRAINLAPRNAVYRSNREAALRELNRPTSNQSGSWATSKKTPQE